MKGRLVRCVSVLMGVLAAFDGGACVAKRGKGKPRNGFDKVKKVKKVKVKEKIVPVIVEKPVVVPVGVSVKYDRTPPLVRLVERWSKASLGNQILGGALFLDILAESVMGFKRLFDWLSVDNVRPSVVKCLNNVNEDMKKKNTNVVVDLGKSEELVKNIGFHTAYIYADKFFDGVLTKGFLLSFLDVASDAAISSLTNRMTIKMSDSSVSEGKEYVLCASLACLCVVLFSDVELGDDKKIIRCFLEACLDAGCVKLDKEGKICEGDGYPLSWKTLTPFRYWGSNGSYNYAGVLNEAIKRIWKKNKGDVVELGGRRIVVS